MSKIKLLKVNIEEYHYNEYDDVKKHIVQGFTDFEEVEDKEISILNRFVQDYNQKQTQKGTNDYLMIVHYHPPLDIKTTIKELFTKEKAEQDEFEAKQKQAKIEREKRLKETSEQKKLKQKERLEKKLAKLNQELK